MRVAHSIVPRPGTARTYLYLRLLKLEISNNINVQIDFGTSQSSGSSRPKIRRYRLTSLIELPTQAPRRRLCHRSPEPIGLSAVD